jgi:serine/threonine protein kinase
MDPSRAENLEADVQIGDFRIERRIGVGGMAVVYLARQVSLDRPVALKILGNALDRVQDIHRFQREAQAIAKLNHPGIAAVHFVGQDGQVCY